MKIPTFILKKFLPKEFKEMLESLRGSRTLILLVISNLPNVIESIANILSGSGYDSLAVSLTKIVTGLLAVLTVIARLIPVEDPPAKISDVNKIVDTAVIASASTHSHKES